MQYVCVKKCFFGGRLWTVGETLPSTPPGVTVPKHFVEKSKYNPEPVPNLKDPKAFSELQKKEAAEALKAVGYGAQAPLTPGPKNAEGQGAPSQPAAGAATTSFLE